jgi:hypothetical protein
VTDPLLPKLVPIACERHHRRPPVFSSQPFLFRTARASTDYEKCKHTLTELRACAKGSCIRITYVRRISPTAAALCPSRTAAYKRLAGERTHKRKTPRSLILNTSRGPHTWLFTDETVLKVQAVLRPYPIYLVTDAGRVAYVIRERTLRPWICSLYVREKSCLCSETFWKRPVLADGNGVVLLRNPATRFLHHPSYYVHRIMSTILCPPYYVHRIISTILCPSSVLHKLLKSLRRSWTEARKKECEAISKSFSEFA